MHLVRLATFVLERLHVCRFHEPQVVNAIDRSLVVAEQGISRCGSQRVLSRYLLIRGWVERDSGIGSRKGGTAKDVDMY